MSLTDTAQLVKDPGFNARVTAAIVTAAQQISGEEMTAGHETYYDKRAQLALEVLRAPVQKTSSFVWGVAVNPTIVASGTAASDGDIQFTVNSVWDDIAGIRSGEAPPPPPA